LKNKRRNSWINVINPFRSLLVIGTPGAGKSYFVIRHVITQHIRKGFTMFLYDFKYDDLSKIAYNTLLKYRHHYPVKPKFYVINFEDLSCSHRCNPLDPSTMEDITDASESSRTIMLGLNREWIKRQGDFFVESPINFVTAIIWFLKKYEEGRYCTLPHVIELMQLDYKILFPLLRKEPEIDVLINPFESAFRNEAREQLEGQVASAKISMARLSSPQLYYVLSGNDFTLDINNSKEPKIVCMGNNPQKQQIYGAVLSLYISRVIKLVNKKHRQKSSLVFDEFPTIYFNGIDSLIATARANKVATTLAVQDYSQLKKDYGRDQAEVIMNIVGNVISGQVVGDTAKLLSERFGKIVQERKSVSINRSDTSISRSTQLDSAIPASKIAALSSGEFVGMVADNPDQKIDLKVFHSEILNDHEAIRKEEGGYQPIPAVRKINQQEILENYYRIKEDIGRIIEEQLEETSH
jgi:DNA-binding transcriptional regulator YbjK